MNLYTEEIKLKEENRLFYSDTGETKELGCIGHLRGDFGHDGKEFWTTWWPHNDALNTQAFKTELDAVVNWMRQDFGPLSNLQSMSGFCSIREDKAKIAASQPAYGFQIETPEHQYFLRCNPTRGDYNFYLYICDRNAQREYAREAPKQEKKSVLAQLKAKVPEQSKNKKAPEKSAEMEI